MFSFGGLWSRTPSYKHGSLFHTCVEDSHMLFLRNISVLLECTCVKVLEFLDVLSEKRYSGLVLPFDSHS